MQQATRLIAVRHGETAWNLDTRLQGHTDIPLNDTGLEQAARAGQALADEAIDALYASDLARAWQTAQAIGRAQPSPREPVADARLRERAFGRYEGLRFAELDAQQPEDARRWRQRDPDFAPPGGENLRQFSQRITAAVNDIAARHPGQLVVLVAHGGVMDVLYRAATGQELQAPRSWSLSNAAINRLLWTPQGLTLVGWDDVAHLATAALDENDR